MKVLLVTIAIGQQYLKEYELLFKESQQNYAKKQGYDFKVITDFLDKDKNNMYKSTISFNKILVCNQEWSNNYDFIIFIDADILININSPPIHNYIDYENCIGIIDEYSQPTKEKRIQIQKQMGWESNATDYYKLCDLDIQTDMVFNTGVLVLQPKYHANFLQNIYNKYIKKSISHHRGFHYEQSCIGYEIQKANLYKVLPNRFNSVWSLIKLDNNMINNNNNNNNTSLESYFKSNYFTHFAGHNDYDKVAALHKNYNIPNLPNLPNLPNQIFKILVVHYSKLVDRKANILKQFAKYNITNFEFIEKYDKDEITEEQSKCFSLTYKKPSMSLHLKHFYAYREIAIKYNNALIFEDDAILADNFIDKLNKYLLELPKDFDMLFIGNGCNLHIESNELLPNKHIYEKCLYPTNWGGNGATRCTDSYIVNKKCAIKLCEYISQLKTKIDLPIDFWINNAARDNNLKVYWAEPTIVTQGSENGKFNPSC